MLGDLRGESDPTWIANGTHVILEGLVKATELNQQTAEVIGFSDEHMRYRVRLHSDGAVRVVDKKHIRPYLPSGMLPAASSPTLALQAAIPSKEDLLQSLIALQENVAELQMCCHEREQNVDESQDAENMSEVFSKCVQSFDMLSESLCVYAQAHELDDELEAGVGAARRSFENSADAYFKVRTWAELVQDELSLTMSAVHKHGIVDTLQQEFRGVASNAVDLVGSAANLAQHGSQQFTPLLRSTSRKFQTRTQVAVSTAGNVVRSTRRQAGSAIEEHVTMRLKRVWHLFLMSLILCWVVPIVALRPYHPLNSVVGNLGLLWGIFWVVCPPRQARHRGRSMEDLPMKYLRSAARAQV
jgi:hypothetical protein